jgi:MFS family permease
MRTVRSIGQGALVVDFALYLHELGWSAVAISGVLSGALLVGSVLTLIVGPLSDRIGRRQFLLVYEGVQLVVALAAAMTANPWILGGAGIIGGFGRGGNGSAGPFSPVEQAWLAQSLEKSQRGRIYSLNAAGGSLGMAAGAFMAAIPAFLTPVLPGALSYRPLFVLTALCSLVCVALIWLAHDAEARPRANAPEPPAPVVAADDLHEAATRKEENGLIFWLVVSNLLNGSGIGLTGPLISYWFVIRFGEGPDLIGPLMAVGFLLSAVALIGTGWLSQRVGIVRAVVLLRIGGLVMLVALPFAPNFAIAAVLYTLRSISNRGTMGARNALSVGIVRPHRRGLAASAANVSLQIPRAVGPVIAGALFQSGFLQLPFLIGAVFQAGFIYVYDRSFGRRDLD